MHNGAKPRFLGASLWAAKTEVTISGSYRVIQLGGADDTYAEDSIKR